MASKYYSFYDNNEYFLHSTGKNRAGDKVESEINLIFGG